MNKITALNIVSFMLTLAGTGIVWAAPGDAKLADKPSDRPAVIEIDAATDHVIQQGLTYLAGEQTDDGSWGGPRYPRNVAIASLACLAFMCDGNMPGRGRYGAEVERGLDFVLRSTSASGFVVADPSHGPMYSHGFGTLFLAEVYGMTQRTDVRDKLTRAIQLIVNTQHRSGGWRYRPMPEEPDLSVTICQIMALRAARNAGIAVPKETVDRCIEYVRASQNPDGGFRYMLHQGSSDWPRSAAGIVALYSAGVYEDKTIEKGLQYLMKYQPNQTRSMRGGHYFYGHYYAVQAMYQAGGRYWERWYPAIRQELVSRQRSDGSWADSSQGAPYATAMACIVLQIPNSYLPIFQR